MFMNVWTALLLVLGMTYLHTAFCTFFSCMTYVRKKSLLLGNALISLDVTACFAVIVVTTRPVLSPSQFTLDEAWCLCNQAIQASLSKVSPSRPTWLICLIPFQTLLRV